MVNKRKSLPLKKIFGTNVRLERVRQGITQEELAHRLGQEQGYVSQIESAKIVASLDVVDRVAEALGVTYTALLDETLGRREG
ncbi:helix-turn-helix domain-containing protein [Solimonas sp. SE-A11]|uniref:helix-turn-helix domain-containing protein n=1 Tax=Solimonas sp. SE-A11 TaxID=3054954 RepID=UPI00259CE200|nr:helix-turn-helix transcriptional regulator [Solimonas sp. SE-A11]MDM4769060.1 helix-turn-helix transcriptional regulator [Solimonas sp. SE-A11]